MVASSAAARDVARFLVAGGVNTALTTGVYLTAALVLQPVVAYAIAWGVGLLFVAIVYPDRVFEGGRTDARARLALVGVTVAVFLIGAAMLQALVELTQVHQIAFLITLAITTLLNFLLARTVLRGL